MDYHLERNHFSRTAKGIYRVGYDSLWLKTGWHVLTGFTEILSTLIYWNIFYRLYMRKLSKNYTQK